MSFIHVRISLHYHQPADCYTGSSQRKTNLFSVIPTVICPRIPSPRCLGRPSSPPCLPLQLLQPHPAPPPLKSLAVLWSGATPPLTQGSGPPREGWAIPESLWCAALCPCVLMVQSPLSKATWELHSSACLTHSGPTETPSTPTVRCVVLSWNQRGWDVASFNFELDKEIKRTELLKVNF